MNKTHQYADFVYAMSQDDNHAFISINGHVYDQPQLQELNYRLKNGNKKITILSFTLACHLVDKSIIAALPKYAKWIKTFKDGTMLIRIHVCNSKIIEYVKHAEKPLNVGDEIEVGGVISLQKAKSTQNQKGYFKYVGKYFSKAIQSQNDYYIPSISMHKLNIIKQKVINPLKGLTEIKPNVFND